MKDLIAEATKVANFFNTQLRNLGFEATVEHDTTSDNFAKILIWDQEDDCEWLGSFITDLTTFQWRNVWSKEPSGSAAQGKADARTLLVNIIGAL